MDLTKFAIEKSRVFMTMLVILLISGIIAFPPSWKSKMMGAGIGLAVLFVVNVIRVVSLVIAGKYIPQHFDLLHEEIWQILFILLMKPGSSTW